MAEPGSENERLARRLASISAALRSPPAKANGGARPVALTDQHFPALAQALVPFIREVVADAVEPLIARNAVCEDRIAELEQRRPVSYEGVWDAARSYAPGMLTTHDGSIWHANVLSTGVQPGSADAWTLAVKRGRDAKGR